MGFLRACKSEEDGVFLSWLSVIETVPQKWKQQIRRGKHIVTSDSLQNKVIPVIAAKQVYNKLLNKI